MNASFSRSDIANVSIVLNDGQRICRRIITNCSDPAGILVRIHPGDGRTDSVQPDHRVEQPAGTGHHHRQTHRQSPDPRSLRTAPDRCQLPQGWKTSLEKCSWGKQDFIHLDERGHYVYHPQRELIGTFADPADFGMMLNEPTSHSQAGPQKSADVQFLPEAELADRHLDPLSRIDPRHPIYRQDDLHHRGNSLVIVPAGAGFAASLMPAIRRLPSIT